MGKLGLPSKGVIGGLGYGSRFSGGWGLGLGLQAFNVFFSFGYVLALAHTGQGQSGNYFAF